MLDELRVPRAIHHASLAPVEHELGYGIFYKTAIDAGNLQYTYRILAGPPLSRHLCRQLEGSLAGLLIAPLFQDMLVERITPGKACLASIPPVAHEFRNQSMNEFIWNTVLLALLYPVQTWLPIRRDQRGAAAAWHSCRFARLR